VGGRAVTWHAGDVGLLFRLLELLIVVVPIAVGLMAAIRAVSSVRRQRDGSPDADYRPDTDAVAAQPAAVDPAALWRTLTRVIEEHSRTDARWLDYELDPAKLLDFPLMTDLRNPLTERFHRAKVRADMLRPVRAEDLLHDRASAADYRAAVEDYVSGFDAAEAEAIRKRRNDFSEREQQRIARAQRLLRVASDEAASRNEREQAYEFAHDELEGLIVLPPATRAAIERGIAGEIDP
jgi:hypothetical protein